MLICTNCAAGVCCHVRMHAIPTPKKVDRWTEKRSMFGVYDNIGILGGCPSSWSFETRCTDQQSGRKTLTTASKNKKIKVREQHAHHVITISPPTILVLIGLVD